MKSRVGSVSFCAVLCGIIIAAAPTVFMRFALLAVGAANASLTLFFRLAKVNYYTRNNASNN